MGNPIWLGEVQLGASDSVVTTNASAQNVSATSGVYLHSATAGESLVGLVQAAIVAVVGAGYTLSFSYTTGKVTFTNASGTNASTTFSAAMAARLGLSSTTLAVNNGANSTGSYPCLTTWQPGKRPASRNALDGEIGFIDADTVGSLQRDGSVYTTAYETRYSESYQYTLLAKQLVYPTTGYTYQDAKGLWSSVLYYGRRIRLIEDPSVATTPLATYYPLEATSKRFAPKRSIANYMGFWNFGLELSAVGS